MNSKYDIRDFLLEQIDAYKYGKITGDEFCRTVEEFLGTHPLFTQDDDLKRVTDIMIPEIRRSYADFRGDDKDKALKFWIGLKDCEYLLLYGRTFSEERQNYCETGLDRADPVEYTDRFLAIEPEMERLVRQETGEGGYLGFCHRYWAVKKRVLKERFGIDWRSPAERYPGVMFD